MRCEFLFTRRPRWCRNKLSFIYNVCGVELAEDLVYIFK
jgi:hypothetical protein